MAHISVENIKKLIIDFSKWSIEDLQNAMQFIFDSVSIRGHLVQLNGILNKEKILAMSIKAFNLDLISEEQLAWLALRYVKYVSFENLIENLDQETIIELNKFTF